VGQNRESSTKITPLDGLVTGKATCTARLALQMRKVRQELHRVQWMGLQPNLHHVVSEIPYALVPGARTAVGNSWAQLSEHNKHARVRVAREFAKSGEIAGKFASGRLWDERAETLRHRFLNRAPRFESGQGYPGKVPY
jgi:hypothetical protein